VVSGYQVNRDTGVGDLYQGFEGFFNDQRGDFAPKKQISTMDDKVHIFYPSNIQNMMVIREEVSSTPPPLNPRMDREIKSKMGICKEQDFYEGLGHVNLA
jgi:hypothetical protein